jgi:hypothetical protein
MGLASVFQLVASTSLLGHQRTRWNMPPVVLDDHTGGETRSLKELPLIRESYLVVVHAYEW